MVVHGGNRHLLTETCTIAAAVVQTVRRHAGRRRCRAQRGGAAYDGAVSAPAPALSAAVCDAVFLLASEMEQQCRRRRWDAEETPHINRPREMHPMGLYIMTQSLSI